MSANVHLNSKPSSRRALLAGALGSLGALAASAIGRTTPVRAADGEIIHTGDELTATSVTKITNSTNGEDVLWGNSTGTGIGVHGSSTSFIGVWGSSSAAYGVYGTSTASYGVFGYADAIGQPATVGQSASHWTGVQGYSGGGILPPPRAKTGVYGYAAQDSGSKGVWGESPAGHAVQGTSSSGFAGYFAGKVYTSKFVEMPEIAAPSAPGANKSRLFTRDNGSGKTQLCVRFNTGAVQVIATQP